MKLEVFSIYDSKAEAYLPPFFLPMVGQATRIFQNAACDTGHTFGANPGDYTLFHIGTWDDNTSRFELQKTPKSLGLAQEFKTAAPIQSPQLDLVDILDEQKA